MAGTAPARGTSGAGSRRLAGLLLLLTGLAVALWLPGWWLPPLPSGGFDRETLLSADALVAGGALLVGFLVFEGTQAHIEVRRQTFSLSLSEAPLVVGLALVAPPVLLVSRLAASVLIYGYRRTAPVKAAFNLALAAAETGIAVQVAAAISPVPAHQPGGWLAAVAGILVADFASAVWVTIAVTATQGRP